MFIHETPIVDVSNFGNYHQKRLDAETELRKINAEINRVTEKLTICKYHVQKLSIEYQYAQANKSNVDKDLSFKLATNFNRPKLDMHGYLEELTKVTQKFIKAREHLGQLPSKIDDYDVNIYFPENMRWKVDHLQKIRQEGHLNVDKSHFEYKSIESDFLEKYQKKKDKLEWSISQIQHDNTISNDTKSKRLKLAKQELDKLSKNITHQLSKLSKDFPVINVEELVQRTNLVQQLSQGRFKKYPIILETESDETPNQRIMKRRLINMDIQKERYRNKIEKLKTNPRPAQINNVIYSSANELIKYNDIIQNNQERIREMNLELEYLAKYLVELRESQNIILEEIKVLDSIKLLSNDEIINTLANHPPLIFNTEEDETNKTNELYSVPIQCIVPETKHELSTLNTSQVDSNIVTANTDLLDTNTLEKNIGLSNSFYYLPEDHEMRPFTGRRRKFIKSN